MLIIRHLYFLRQCICQASLQLNHACFLEHLLDFAPHYIFESLILFENGYQAVFTRISNILRSQRQVRIVQ